VTPAESFTTFSKTTRRSVWSDSSKTCQLYSGLSYKVFFAKMGYTDNPQNYIVKVEKSAI